MPTTTKPASVQDNDTRRTEQYSHGDKQNRSKKDGHTSQIGSGQDQQSARRSTGGHRGR